MNTSRTFSNRLENIAIWTCEGGLALVVRMDLDLMTTRVTIQVAEEVSQPL
jgi:hypothetical protein